VPSYIDLIRIDWHVAETPAELHEAISAANERCTGSDHTLLTVQEGLEAAARLDPRIMADALCDTGFNSFTFLFVRDGQVAEVRVDEVPEHGEPHDPPYDEAAAELDLQLHFDDEDQLREALESIRPTKPATFVATAGDRRFLVELTPEQWSMSKLLVVTQPALFAKLMAEDYARPVAKRPARLPNQKYSQALYLSEGQLGWMQQMAVKRDASLSWIAQRAVRLAGQKLGELGAKYIAPEGVKQRQTLYFPGLMLDQLEVVAAAQDCSISKLVQAALTAAKSEIENV